jgi:hypothetical protein
MALFALLLGVYVFVGLLGAMALLRAGPQSLLLFSVMYVVITSVLCVAMVIESRSLNAPLLELAGQSLQVFFSVVGGALFASAWSEKRAQRLGSKHDG